MSPIGALFFLYVITCIMTEVLTNNGAAGLAFPVGMYACIHVVYVYICEEEQLDWRFMHVVYVYACCVCVCMLCMCIYAKMVLTNNGAAGLAFPVGMYACCVCVCMLCMCIHVVYVYACCVCVCILCMCMHVVYVYMLCMCIYAKKVLTNNAYTYLHTYIHTY